MPSDKSPVVDSLVLQMPSHPQFDRGHALLRKK
jgi:hypothetical protein